MAPVVPDPPEFELTDEAYWDEYWRQIALPAVVERHPRTLYLNAILDRFDAHLPATPGLRALEIGGAPGQYLVHLHRQFGYAVTCLDYSPLGCAKTRENFALLGVDGEVVEGDLFDDALELEPFDVVYSLGLVEHFGELEDVVARHLRFVKPGGILILGLPNFLGVNGWFMRRLAPEILAVCDLRSMELDRWSTFEDRLGLHVLFRGYLGGLEPCVFRARQPALKRRPLARAVHAVDLVLHGRLRWLRRFNGRAISGYAFGIYRI